MKTKNSLDRTVHGLALVAAVMFPCFTANAALEKAEVKPKPAIEMGAPFADNAILQREMYVPVWGWAEPGTKITVEFAGQKKTVTTGLDGNPSSPKGSQLRSGSYDGQAAVARWMVRLDPLKASDKPAEMVISDSEGKRVVLRNILVGEVWMASGQSSMQSEVDKSSCNFIIKALKEKGELPPIREFKVTNVFSSLYPIEHALGAWSDGSDFTGYSAIAFAFAQAIQQELKIPVGILNCSFGATTIQSWIPREGIESGTDEYTKGLYSRILEGDFRTAEHKAAWDRYYQDVQEWARKNVEKYKNGHELAAAPVVPGNLNGNRDISWMFNGKISPVIPYAIRGAIWDQGHANAGESLVYYNSLHSLIRGWRMAWGKPFPVYFLQFYTHGNGDDGLSLNSTAEMRLGTWLARDIPDANMACQVDIGGAVDYYNKAVPGQRLARHALKHQYGKNDLVADGPMFRSYSVEGSRLVVEFDFAEGGLLVGETGSKASGRGGKGPGIEHPTIIENGKSKVMLFYIADENRVWYRAEMKIEGSRVVLTSPKVSAPRGVAYAVNGVSWQPNLYNRALLPMAPFIYYDNKLVTSDTWPDDPIKVDGVVPEPWSTGKQYEYRKLSLLGTQFRANGVIQAGVPTPFFGEAPAGSTVKFSFAGTEKTITVGPDDSGWQFTAPALPASAEPKNLLVMCELDGEIIHTESVTNIVAGDVWYVAVPDFDFFMPIEKGDGNVRVLTPSCLIRSRNMPFRYRIESSGSEDSRFYSKWRPASELSRKAAGDVFANILGRRIFAKTGKPVGIILVDTKDPELKTKYWIGHEWLKQAPSLTADYVALQLRFPDNQAYLENIERFIADWKTFWNTVPPQVLETKGFPPGQGTMVFPSIAAGKDSPATQTYNQLIAGFSPGNFKGVIFLGGKSLFNKDKGAHFGPEFSVMANCWKESFALRQDSGQVCDDPCFFYTIPCKALAPKITLPRNITGRSAAYEIGHWLTAKPGNTNDMAVVNRQLMGLIDLAVGEAYNK